jgi:hypothetical protein
MRVSALFMLDAAINLVVGALLLVFPAPLVTALAVPASESAFYASLLGAVLLGIAIALSLQRFRAADGLGLMGALSINLSGGFVLAGWLLLGHLKLAWRGQVLLWALVLILIGISTIELVVHASGRRTKSA